MTMREYWVPVIVMALAVVGLGCSTKRSAAEKEALRQGVQEEIRIQQEGNAARDRAWKELREQFDKDNDGSLNRREKAALQAHLKKIHNGTAKNPFPE